MSYYNMNTHRANTRAKEKNILPILQHSFQTTTPLLSQS